MENKLSNNLLIGVMTFAALLLALWIGFSIGQNNAAGVNPNNNCFLTAPTELNYDESNDLLEWDAVGSSGYFLTAIDTDPGSTYLNFSTTNTQISIDDLGLLPGHEYDIYLQAICSDNGVASEYTTSRVCIPSIVIEETIMLQPAPPIDTIPNTFPSTNSFILDQEAGLYSVTVKCGGTLWANFLLEIAETSRGTTCRIDTLCGTPFAAPCGSEIAERLPIIGTTGTIEESSDFTIAARCGQIKIYHPQTDCEIAVYAHPQVGPTPQNVTEKASDKNTQVGLLQPK